MSINNYNLIDEAKWGRKDIFEFFRPFLDSSVSVTTEVECGVTFSECKSKGTSFFLHSLYAVLKAANEIPELRYRLKDGKPVIYDRVDALTPIKVNSMGKFVEAFVQYDTDFMEFYREAYSIIHALNEKSDPYAFVNAHRGELGLMTISVTPRLFFTSIKHTQRQTYGNDYPLLNIGKVVSREGKLVMPVAITVNHAFVDGHQLGMFFDKMNQWLSTYHEV